MPNRTEHLAASAANEVLSGRLLEMREYGWSVTCLFYAALHLTEAYLQDHGQTSSSHSERGLRLRNDQQLAPIRRRYGLLKRESENARYECRQFTPQETAYLREFIYAPLASQMRNFLGAT